MSAKELDDTIMAAINRYNRRHLALTAEDVRKAFERLDKTMTAAEAANAAQATKSVTTTSN